MSNRFFKCLRLSITFYVCISLIGCTSASYRQAQAYANREPKYWTIEDVTFAAIREQRYLRMCVKLRHFHEEAITEVKLDINKITEQLKDENNTIESFEQGAKLHNSYQQYKEKGSDKKYSQCNTELQKDEVRLPIIFINSDNSNIESVLLDIKQESLEGPALILIDHDYSHYLVLGIPKNLYPELSEHAFRCYAEDQKEPERYLLVPLAFAGDAFLAVGAVGTVVICIALLPLCIIVVAMIGDFEEGKFINWVDAPRYFPLPSPTTNPDCD